ncbi:5'/3'-nucleotidase SurE [Thermococcus sp. M39]|uniref:5'/3'-nucleotidase SurE n=1 Tax=unclassified Thermococcus TaxID=2627626 RepID=UPI00143CBB43|nr:MULTISPECIES: 5'/3'-nucleotidase SurE [unclassified Thermococcus]NJE08782.1 5'/3'-nucleotidase SurE [Thermococcus sp. M39]NJE12015.1 5'/3'-nucleotidase SurE [Thermococcus sp. LS2]
MPKILITNDDGIYSKGIRAAVEALQELGEIYVVAPMFQRSASGRAMTLHRPLRAKRVNMEGARAAYALDGMPVDCIIFALARFGSFDLAISGINLGENMSTEITISGTASAAIEAATHGIPSIAISLEVDREKHKFGSGEEIDFTMAKLFLKKIAEAVLKRGLPEGVDMLNVNVPYDANENTPIEITRLARRMYNPSIEERIDPKGTPYYWIVGTQCPREVLEPGTDMYAVKVERKVSVTPINIDMTARVDLGQLRKHLGI